MQSSKDEHKACICTYVHLNYIKCRTVRLLQKEIEMLNKIQVLTENSILLETIFIITLRGRKMVRRKATEGTPQEKILGPNKIGNRRMEKKRQKRSGETGKTDYIQLFHADNNALPCSVVTKLEGVLQMGLLRPLELG